MQRFWGITVGSGIVCNLLVITKGSIYGFFHGDFQRYENILLDMPIFVYFHLE